MKIFFSSTVLTFLSSLTLLPAQEAWLLEMPHKYSDYLLKKAIAGDHDTVAGIIEKIPNLIAAKQVREIDLIQWKAKEGKVHKKAKVTQAQVSVTTGAQYTPIKGDSLKARRIKITPASATAPVIKIDVAGVIPREWTPSFVHRGEKLTLLVLERHSESETATVSLSHSRQLEFDAGPHKEVVTWYCSDSLDAMELSYQSQISLLANPMVKFGTKIFSSIHKDGPSLLRIEAHSQDPAGNETVILQHTEAKFDGHSQTEGSLKSETIKVADKSFKIGEDKGAWTLTLTSE